jgi:Short repeat of unknown function (DUF308)
LLQLPPSLKFDEPVVSRFLSTLHERFSEAVVSEPRRASWFSGGEGKGEANADAFLAEHIIENDWLMIITGIAFIVMGLVLYIFPGVGALSLVWLIDAYSIAFGLLLIFLALRLRGFHQPYQTAGASPAPRS